jgi:hypothetical protein
VTEPKTRPTDADVDAFLAGIPDERRREDAVAVKEIMTRVSGHEPEMWGPSIVGFGRYSYGPPSAQREWMRIGFSPRKQALTLYVLDDHEKHADLFDRLGSHTTGKSCIYIKDLSKVDTGVLEDLIARSLREIDAGSA